MYKPDGDAGWGKPWEYAWFRTEFTTPQKVAGKRLVLWVDTGISTTIFVNGRATGCNRHENGKLAKRYSMILLSPHARPGNTYRIMAESYAGHEGERLWLSFPVPLGKSRIASAGDQRQTIGACTYGEWNEDAYQLWMDIATLEKNR